MSTKVRMEYTQQSPYNQNFVPTAPQMQAAGMPDAPPSYDDAVAVTSPAVPNTNLHIYPAIPPNPPVVSVPAPVVHVKAAVGPVSCLVVCPNCHKNIKTRIRTVPQQSAYILGCILCILGCCCCSCIPCCLKAFKDVQHFCPECKTFIGTFKP